MTKAFYDKIAGPFERDACKRKKLLRINSAITGAVYLVYPAVLFALFLLRDGRFFKVLFVPGISFLAVTLFRKICNAKRPYEVWDTPPLIPKETKGNSFPSRHVFSITIIAEAAGYICPPLGICLAAAGVFLAAVRVIARVHFVKDVLAGAALAVILGSVGFYLIL